MPDSDLSYHHRTQLQMLPRFMSLGMFVLVLIVVCSFAPPAAAYCYICEQSVFSNQPTCVTNYTSTVECSVEMVATINTYYLFTRPDPGGFTIAYGAVGDNPQAWTCPKSQWFVSSKRYGLYWVNWFSCSYDACNTDTAEGCGPT